MKNLVMSAILLLLAQNAFATDLLSCDPNAAPVTKSGTAEEAFVLLEQIQTLGTTNIINNIEFPRYNSLVAETTSRLGRAAGVIVEAHKVCDFPEKMAAFDPILKDKEGPLSQYEVTITHAYSGKRIGESRPSVLVQTDVILKGSVITGECRNIFNCQSVYQFYLQSVSFELHRAYPRSVR